MLTYFRSKAINFFPHILPGIRVMSQLMEYLLSAPINCGTCHQDHVSRHGIALTTLFKKYLRLFHTSCGNNIKTMWVAELPILPFGSSSNISRLVRVPQFYRENRLLPWGFCNTATSIMQPKWCCNNWAASFFAEQWNYFNEDASYSLNKAIIKATTRKYPDFACPDSHLVPHSPWLVPQACLSCLRQLESICGSFLQIAGHNIRTMWGGMKYHNDLINFRAWYSDPVTTHMVSPITLFMEYLLAYSF